MADGIHPGRSLKGRTALVTGAARRLGREMALRLGTQGARVVVHYRGSEAAATETVAAIAQRSGEAWAVQADLAEPKEAEALLGRASELAGSSVDLLVNNASLFPEASLADSAYDQLDLMMRIHAWAPLALSRAIAKSGIDHGAVVNMLDTRIVSQDAAHVPYIMSKRALADLTRSLAVELAPRIRVNGVAPGAVLPPEGKGENHLEPFRERAPLKRLVEPREITDAVLYLLTADAVTGQVLFVDGGRHLV